MHAHAAGHNFVRARTHAFWPLHAHAFTKGKKKSPGSSKNYKHGRDLTNPTRIQNNNSGKIRLSHTRTSKEERGEEEEEKGGKEGEQGGH